MTNGAGNVVELVQLHQECKPSGIIWVQFDHPDVGHKTRIENRIFMSKELTMHGPQLNLLLHNLLLGETKQCKLLESSFHYALQQQKQFTGHRVILKQKLLQTLVLGEVFHIYIM